MQSDAQAIEHAIHAADLHNYFCGVGDAEYAEEVVNAMVSPACNKDVEPTVYGVHPTTQAWATLAEIEQHHAMQAIERDQLVRVLKGLMDYTVQDIRDNATNWCLHDIPAFIAASNLLKSMGVAYELKLEPECVS